MKWSNPSRVGCPYSRIHLGGLFRIARESSDGSGKTSPFFISTYFFFQQKGKRERERKKKGVIRTLKWICGVSMICVAEKSSNRLRAPGTFDNGLMGAFRCRHRTAFVYSIRACFESEPLKSPCHQLYICSSIKFRCWRLFVSPPSYPKNPMHEEIKIVPFLTIDYIVRSAS